MFAGTDFFVPQDFASADATKGLSDRPLETFGPPCGMFAGADEGNKQEGTHMYKKVATDMNFPAREKEITARWKQNDVIRRSFGLR